MAISDRYFEYLNHFNETIPVLTFAKNENKPGVCLRHDVDHDLDLALELGYWEARNDIQSTYFIRHDADYRNDPRYFEKCMQLQDFGHEVGLHINLLASWYRGHVANIGDALARLVDEHRAAGINISGVSAHGDPLCYSEQFTNYWLYEDLRPSEPWLSEVNVNAEGVQYAATGPDRSITYREGRDVIVRPDGKSFEFWSLNLKDFDLEYEASRLPTHAYFSDSGGQWNNGDPLETERLPTRCYILMHPVHWRGTQRHYYILSPPRSGSKWLTEFLNTATSLTARHEFALNMSADEPGKIGAKRTALGFRDLDDDSARDLIWQARAYCEQQVGDQAEVNVYLWRYSDCLPKDEATTIIHLHREPAEVISSMLNRGWYDVADSDRYPSVEVAAWHEMSPFEKTCCLVSTINATLQDVSSTTLEFARMVNSPRYLLEKLPDLGIAVYPRLVSNTFSTSVDPTTKWLVQTREDWSVNHKQTYSRYFEPSIGTSLTRHILATIRWAQRVLASLRPRRPPQVKWRTNLTFQIESHQLNIEADSVQVNEGTLWLKPHAHRSSYVLLAGGAWRPSEGSYAGWDCYPWLTYAIRLSFSECNVPRARLLCLSYASDGELVEQRDIAQLAGQSVYNLRFRPRRDAVRFNLALFMEKRVSEGSLMLNSFELIAVEDRLEPNLEAQDLIELCKSAPLEEVTNSEVILVIEDHDHLFRHFCQRNVGSWNLEARILNAECIVSPRDSHRHAYLLSHGGEWATSDQGISLQPKGVREAIHGSIAGRARGHFATVFILAYKESGALVAKVRVGKISEAPSWVAFHVALDPSWSRVQLAAHLPVGCNQVALSSLRIHCTNSPIENST